MPSYCEELALDVQFWSLHAGVAVVYKNEAVLPPLVVYNTIAFLPESFLSPRKIQHYYVIISGT
jgi:hypothetical protein